MTTTFKIKELKRYLRNHQPVDTKQLLQFYRSFDFSLSFSTLRWRIHELKKREIIYSPKRGQYALREKEAFPQYETPEMKDLARLIQVNYPEVKFSIFTTEWLTRFSDYTYFYHNLVVDVEGQSLNNVFQLIKQHHSNVFLSPDETKYRYYLSPDQENIIVNRLHVDAPLNNIDSHYYVPKFEKLIVDLMINSPIILMISKHEMKHILTRAQEKHHINFSTLRRYAKKRYLGKHPKDFGLLNHSFIS